MEEPKRLLDRKKRPLRIAIVGIDGTGKTTVRKTVEKVLGEKYEVSRMRPLPTQENKQGITRNLKKLQDMGHEKNRPDIIFLTQLLHAPSMPFRRLKKEKKSDVIIHDRHMLIDGEVYAKDYVPGNIRKARYLSGTTKPDIIIHLKCDPKKAYKRITERQLKKDPRKKFLHIHEKPGRLVESDKKFDEVIEKIRRKNPRIKVLRINANQEEKKVLKEVEEEMRKLL